MKVKMYNTENIEKVKSIRNDVDNNSHIIDNIVDEIIQPYCKDLDKYIMFISGCLGGGESAPTNAELEDFCMNLSTLIYFASSKCEQLGIRDDMSKTAYKEVYNSIRSEQDTGTVADKDSLAELGSQAEQITNICFNRAYKIMKAKIENAQELLGSCKKCLTHRIQEMQLTQLSE